MELNMKKRYYEAKLVLDKGKKVSYNIMMKINKVFGSLFVLLISLFFSSPVFAGGAEFIPYADTSGWVVSPDNSSPGYGRNIRVYINPMRIPCQGTEISFRFADLKDGDFVMTASGNSTVILTDNICETYAKMSSKEPGERQVDIQVKSINPMGWIFKVDFDGQYHPDTEQNGYLYRTSLTNPYINNNPPTASPTPTPQPIGLPAKSIHVKVDSQRYIEGPKRYVYLSWNRVEGAARYNVYARPSDTKEYGGFLVATGSLSAEIGINAFLDFYIKVDACNSAGCISSSEVFVPRMQKNDDKIVNTPTPIVTTSPEPTNSNIEELNKKVDNLENQLQASQKKQSALELKFNQLVKWIKSIFPFFK